jgi:hypothetical protein
MKYVKSYTRTKITKCWFQGTIKQNIIKTKYAKQNSKISPSRNQIRSTHKIDGVFIKSSK